MICKRMRMAAVHSINREDRKMKKILIFAAIVAVLLLASCQKEVPVETAKEDTSTVVEPPVFTATISPGTKTTVDATKGKVSWEKTDVITVIDSLSNKAVYEVSSIDNTTGKATFVFKSGNTLAKKGPYTATYGEAPKTAQTYSETPGNLCMTAPATLTNSFNFTVNCGLLEINLTKEKESVKSVAVSGIPKGESATTYTLTCSTAQSIASKKAFYIAVPAGKYHKIVITDRDGMDCTLTSASGIAVDTNHIKPVTFDDSKLVFKPNPLSGEFSVSSTKKVRFSRGNLVATIDATGKPVAWKFAAHQYDCLVTGGANTKIGSAAGDVDLFGWSTDADSNNWGIHTKTDTAKGVTTGNFKEWGRNIDKQGIWRTLNYEEWKYLLGTKGTVREGRAVGPYEVCGVKNCLILVPDDFISGSIIFPSDKKYNQDKWNEAENAGFVCLPPSGYRHGSTLTDVEQGFYWSSSIVGDGSNAYCLNFNAEAPNCGNGSRYHGFCVRLVTDVQK